MKLALLVTLLLALGLVAAGSVSADAKAKATLVVTPTPVYGGEVSFSGCGYQPGVGVQVAVYEASAVNTIGDVADANGCFDTSPFYDYYIYDHGTYNVYSYEVGNNHKVVASLTFIVP